MNDDELRRAYAAYRSATPRSEPADTNRPTLEELRQLVDGEAVGEEREALLDNALADARSARELSLLQAMADGTPRARRWKPAHWWTLAAAAVLLVAVTPLLRAPRESANDATFRAAPNGETVEIIAPPDGTPLVAGLAFKWKAVPNVERYVVEIVADNGDAIASITTRETSLTLPDSIAAERFARATGWMLVAKLRDGGQRQSVLRLTAKRTP
jgi:hypothetical protein